MKDLFDNEIILPPGGEQKGRLAEHQHAQLLSFYGKINAKCKDCKFLLREHRGKVYLKCEKARNSNSAATDWRANWQACGLFVVGLLTRGHEK